MSNARKIAKLIKENNVVASNVDSEIGNTISSIKTRLDSDDTAIQSLTTLAASLTVAGLTDSDLKVVSNLRNDLDSEIASTKNLSLSYTNYIYNATAGQTTFTGSDANGNTLAYNVGAPQVFLNGIKLDADDFTATSGTSVVLTEPAGLNHQLLIIVPRIHSIPVPIAVLSLANLAQQVKIRPTSNNDQHDQFTDALDISRDGNYAIVGARGATGGGRFYIFEKDSDGVGSSWTQRLDAAFTSSGGDSSGGLGGKSVKLDTDGDTAIIGYPNAGAGDNSGRAEIYTRSTVKYDLSVASFYQSSPNFNSQTNSPRGFVFNETGSKIYIMTNDNNGKFLRFSLSTNYDISTMSYDGTSNDKFINQAQSGTGNVAGINNPQNVRIKSDGGKLWISDTSDNKIYQIALGTAWDLDGNLWNQGFFDPNAQSNGLRGFDFSPDGTKLIIVTRSGSTHTKVWEYNVTPSNSLSSSSVSYTGRSVNLYSQSPVISEPISVCWHHDGNAFFVACSSNDKVFKFNLNNSNFELTGVTLSSDSLDISDKDGSVQFITFDKSVHQNDSEFARLYVLGNNSGTNKDQIHEYHTKGEQWSLQAKLEAGNKGSGDQFGDTVAISDDGNTAVVGAQYEDTGGTNAGQAYVFTRSGTTWTQRAQIGASDASTHSNFGHTLAISGDGGYIAVGAPGKSYDSFGSNTGKAYIFTFNGSTATQQAIIVPSDQSSGNHFATSIDIDEDGDTLIVGGKGGSDNTHDQQGVGYYFSRSGSTWTQQQRVISPNPSVRAYHGTRYGNGDGTIGITSDGRNLVIGAHGDNYSSIGSESGAVYSYTRSGNEFVYKSRLEPDDTAASDRVGWTAAIADDGTVLVGSPQDDVGGTNAGSLYVFEVE